ncbi:hypothetical protein ACFO5R_06530 [Halosolutus amylolyticus]|uniref:Uncharacterized protein n=1 Tax=Halosolutus amylolyticus TaxID=2932267 RepID=A0ABD5PLY0_9EURY|nr:hypothetical protein [Halosolutus amylolyticus]
MTHTNWRPNPGLDKKRAKEVWYHTAPHDVNDGEVDGEVSFDDEILEPFRDDESDE